MEETQPRMATPMEEGMSLRRSSYVRCRDGIMMTSRSSGAKCQSPLIQVQLQLICVIQITWSVTSASSLTCSVTINWKSSDQFTEDSVMILVESTCASTVAT